MEEEKFKKIIQKAALDQPPVLFTDNVMHTIGLLEEVGKNETLDKLLQTALLSSPNEEFTNAVMERIIPQKHIAFQPIISKKTWRIISGIAAMVFVAVFLLQGFSKKTANSPSKFNGLFALNNSIFTQIAQQSSIVLICLLSICALLMIDAFLRKRVNVSKLI